MKNHEIFKYKSVSIKDKSCNSPEENFMKKKR